MEKNKLGEHVEKPTKHNGFEIVNAFEKAKEKCDEKDLFAVQFRCGECVKKVKHVNDIDFFDDVAVLTPRHGHFLAVNLFCGGEHVDKELAKVVIVPIKNICSIELGAIKIDH